MYKNFLWNLPGKERGFKGIHGMDVGGSAMASLFTINADGSSVDADGVGIVGVAAGTGDEICCVDEEEDATIVGVCAAGGISSEVHHFFKDTKKLTL